MKTIRQSTLIVLQVGPFVDAIDGVTPETNVVTPARVSKNGGAFGARNSATSITHDENGFYRVELDATDTSVPGILRIAFNSASHHLPVWDDYSVIAPAAYDAWFSGSGAGIPARIVSGTLTAASFATDAITSDVLALSAVSEIVSGVWNANDVTFNTSGSMGYLQNLNDNVGELITLSGIVSGVWTAGATGFNTTGSMGHLQNLIANVAATAVSGVWNATDTLFNTSGTMGYLQNLNDNASTVDTNAIVSGVWNAGASGFNASGSMGHLQNLVAGVASTAVSGVWNAADTLFNTSGTMGYLQNLNDSSTVDTNAIVSGVWNAGASGFNTSGTVGHLQNLIAGIAATAVSGVWNASDTLFNTSGTMGYLQNLNDAATATVDVASIVSGVWNAHTSSFTAPHSMGKLQVFAGDFAGGRWKIDGTNNVHIFFKPDNVTEIARYNLLDSQGLPSVTNVFERTRTGSV
jgi:hypothetical protein